MKKVLIINTHQFYDGLSTGILNNSIVEKGYDIKEEVNKHL